MQQESITVLRHLQKHGGSFVVKNPSELGLTRNAFTVAVNDLHETGSIVQDGLALMLFYGGPVSLRLTETGITEIEQLNLKKGGRQT
jgi:hypothetical protein